LSYCFKENIWEKITFCLPLSDRCARSDIFKAVNYDCTPADISWPNCISICTDGTTALTGHMKSLQGKYSELMLT
jgi:hypothetical protein